ncbi:MAG: hypothetical protein R3E44_02465 [Paracoccaceae bacterium]
MKKLPIVAASLLLAGCALLPGQAPDGEVRPVEGVFRNMTPTEVSNRLAEACGQLSLTTPLKTRNAVECRKPADGEAGVEEVVRFDLAETGSDVGVALIAYKLMSDQGPDSREMMMSRSERRKLAGFLTAMGAEPSS